MDSAVDDALPPVLAGSIPRPGRQTLSALLRAQRDKDPLSGFNEEAYENLLVEIRAPTFRGILVNDPAGIRHVLLDNAANYHKTDLARRVVEPGLGRGLLTSEGATWRAQRRVMAPSFDHGSLRSYSSAISEIAGGLVGSWGDLPPVSVVDVATEMMRVTLQIIAQTMFSSDSYEVADIIERSFADAQAKSMPNLLDLLGLPAWLAGWRRNASRRGLFAEFDGVIHRLIDERRRSVTSDGAAGGRQDLLARLVAAQDDETGKGMSSDEIRSHVITIFLAGHETTALALTWTWYLLSRHPIQEARLHAELAAVLGGRESNQSAE